MQFHCSKCGKRFVRNRNLKHHELHTCKKDPEIQRGKKQGNCNHKCTDCAAIFRTAVLLKRHRSTMHSTTVEKVDNAKASSTADKKIRILENIELPNCLLRAQININHRRQNRNNQSDHQQLISSTSSLSSSTQKASSHVHRDGDNNKYFSGSTVSLYESAAASNAVPVMQKSKAASIKKCKPCETKVLRNDPHYDEIKENVPVHPVQFTRVEEFEQSECACLPTDSHPCGPKNNCINYATYTECMSNCPAKDKCENRRFTRPIYSKLKREYFDRKGWGLITLEDVPRNAFIIEYVGELVNNREFENRFEQSVERAIGFYFFQLKNGLYIDSGERGNLARFINHSCEPNCIAEEWTVDGQTRLGIFATTDIPKASFICFPLNYAFLQVQLFFLSFDRILSLHSITIGPPITCVIAEQKRAVANWRQIQNRKQNRAIIKMRNEKKRNK